MREREKELTEQMSMKQKKYRDRDRLSRKRKKEGGEAVKEGKKGCGGRGRGVGWLVRRGLAAFDV